MASVWTSTQRRWPAPRSERERSLSAATRQAAPAAAFQLRRCAPRCQTSGAAARCTAAPTAASCILAAKRDRATGSEVQRSAAAAPAALRKERESCRRRPVRSRPHSPTALPSPFSSTACEHGGCDIRRDSRASRTRRQHASRRRSARAVVSPGAARAAWRGAHRLHRRRPRGGPRWRQQSRRCLGSREESRRGYQKAAANNLQSTAVCGSQDGRDGRGAEPPLRGRRPAAR
jgi:hypothetical protein